MQKLCLNFLWDLILGEFVKLILIYMITNLSFFGGLTVMPVNDWNEFVSCKNGTNVEICCYSCYTSVRVFQSMHVYRKC